MPIYGKKLHKSSSPEPVGRFPRNLVCIIEDLPIIVCTNDDPGVNLTYFTTRSNLVLWEKVKTVDFSESTAPCDLKVCSCRQLIEFKGM